MHLLLLDQMREIEQRYERKFTTTLSAADVQHYVRVNPKLFRSLYVPRNINNLYLDTPSMDCFREAVEGQRDRTKVRIRWYGDLTGLVPNPKLELKIKNGLLGCKLSYPLPSFHTKDLHKNILPKLFDEANLPPIIREEIEGMEAALLNRYYRSYHLSDDQQFRMTVDSHLAYFSPPKSADCFLHSFAQPDHTVVELKYGEELDSVANEVSTALPFRLAKNSKYTHGIYLLSGEPPT